MAKILKSVVVFAKGKKMTIPEPNKIIVTLRDKDLHQHQASMDINVPNINQIKRLAKRR